MKPYIHLYIYIPIYILTQNLTGYTFSISEWPTYFYFSHSETKAATLVGARHLENPDTTAYIDATYSVC